MLRFSYAKSLTAPLSAIEFADTDALADWFESQPGVVNKTDSPIILPATFPSYPVPVKERTIAHAATTSGAVLDYDDGQTTAEHVADELDSLGLDFMLRTSFSNTPEHPRFFVFVPWAKPCPVEKHAAAVEKLRGMLNGSGGFAAESRVPVQPRFIAGKAGRDTVIITPDAEPWALNPLEIDFDALSGTKDSGESSQQYEPLNFIETSPESRQLFKLALKHIDADAERTDWVAVIGAGLRMWGITTASLRAGTLSDDQWAVIADLEQWSAAGSKDKYRNPESDVGISGCTALRRNADGDMVPSMVVQNARRCIKGTTMMGLTGLIKRVDFEALEAELIAGFPELLSEAQSRHGATPKPVIEAPTEEQMLAASTQAAIAVANHEAVTEEYKAKVEKLFDVMPAGNTKRLAYAIATAGVEGTGTWAMPPPPAVVLACQLVNIILANRVWSVTGQYPPLGGALYTYMFAESGSGKSMQLDFASGMLAGAGYGGAIFNGKVHSEASMQAMLMGYGPAVLITADEVKSWFSNIDAVPNQSNTNQTTLNAIMLSLWGRATTNGQITLNVKAADRVGADVRMVAPIRRPNVSSFMIGVPDDMNLFTAQMLTDGSIARSLCFMPTDARPNETEVEAALRMAVRQNDRAQAKPSTSRDQLLIQCADLLKDFDAALEREGLGESMETMAAGNAFDDQIEGGELVAASYRDLSRARALLKPEMYRVLTVDERTTALVAEYNLMLAQRFPSSKLAPLRLRYAEKATRVALSLTMFDNPKATEIDYERMKFALDLVALAEEPWFNRLMSEKEHVNLRFNKFEKYADRLHALCAVDGPLYGRGASGVSVREIKNDKSFSALASLVRHLASQSDALRNDAKTMLEAFGLLPIKAPARKGMVVIHPEHQPQPTPEAEE